MLRAALTIFTVVLCVDSLSLYSHADLYIVNVPENVDTNSIEQTPKLVPPPPHGEVARMARYIVHNSDWTVVAYKSQHGPTDQFPMGTIISVSDGPVDNSTGIPYVYVSRLEDVVPDTEKDPRCSFTMTLAEGDYCRQKHLDPQYPTCPQVTLLGNLVKVKNGSDEETFARDALFTRHPSMKTWPPDHHFFFMKLDIKQIMVLDYFGGPKYVSVQDYLNAKPEESPQTMSV